MTDQLFQNVRILGAVSDANAPDRRAKEHNALRKLIAVGNLMAVALEMGPDAPRSTRDELAQLWERHLERVQEMAP